MRNTHIFVLDNFDSFVYNLVDEFRLSGHRVSVFRNNVPSTTIKQAMDNCADSAVLVLSPGPGKPSESGCMLDLIDLCAGQFPIVGICLGHQAIVEYFGGAVDRAPEIRHGKSSHVSHDGKRMFSGLKQPLPAARYHSLAATHVSDSLSINASYEDIPMGVVNDDLRIAGFQFHPESILTTDGTSLLRQTVEWATAS
ncbi:MAG: aminodeoxychorismate/anthranilate synthase component II [Deltaproteobacteria bacterium]